MYNQLSTSCFYETINHQSVTIAIRSESVFTMQQWHGMRSVEAEQCVQVFVCGFQVFECVLSVVSVRRTRNRFEM